MVSPEFQLQDISSFYHPLFNLTVVLKTAENETKLNDILPYLNDYQLSSAPSFYLCEGGSCQAPIHSLSELEKIL